MIEKEIIKEHQTILFCLSFRSSWMKVVLHFYSFQIVTYVTLILTFVTYKMLDVTYMVLETYTGLGRVKYYSTVYL
jgi:hypothetical protein